MNNPNQISRFFKTKVITHRINLHGVYCNLLQLLFFAFGLSSAALAAPAPAPTISAVTPSAATLTITGTNFGDKSIPTPIRWDNFEDGTAEATIDSTGYWTMRSGGTLEPKFSVENPRHDGSKLSIRHGSAGTGFCATLDNCPQTGHAAFWKNDVGFKKTKKAFVSFWTRFDWGPGGASDTGGYQIKAFQLAQSIVSTSGVLAYPDLGHESWFDFSGLKRTYTQSYMPDDNKPPEGAFGYINTNPSMTNNFSGATKVLPNTDKTLPDKQWSNIRIQYSASTTPGSADATYKVWYQKGDASGYVLKDIATCSGYTCSWVHPGANSVDYYNRDLIDSLKISYILTNVEDSFLSITPYTDDVYMDNSWARVELCNANTYIASGHCEMQPPTAWANEAITTTFNKGSFKVGDTVYVYVIDENGVPNSTGASFTIGVVAPAVPKEILVEPVKPVDPVK